MLKRETKFLNQAVRMAEDIELFGDARVFAILAYKNELISFGWNTSKSHTIATKYTRKENAIYPHAEVMAIHNASKRLKLQDFRKSTLYVARVKRPFAHSNQFIWGLAKPCEGCQRAIEQFDIREVIYTTDEGSAEIWHGGQIW